MAELAAMDRLLDCADGHGQKPVLMLLGEPGIGKSRLFAEIAERVRARGGSALVGRAYEAEMVRPYGPWADALRALPAALVPTELRSRLAALVPELGQGAGPHDRASLFDAVAQLLLHLAKNAAPVAVLLDDLHWIDDASAALVHYVARAVSDAPILIACAARSGELSDNAAALRLVRGLSRAQRSETLELGPLTADAIAELAHAVAPQADASRVARDSSGNPLLALELARALATNPNAVWDSLSGLIGERLALLSDGALELSSWAAALGRYFDLDTLERVAGIAPVELLASMNELERRRIVRASPNGSGYDFAHDLLRTGAYRRLSEPIRRMVHRRIARTLHAMNGSDGMRAAEVMHHAQLGGEAALVASAAPEAAQHCLKVFASNEGARLAELGLLHVHALPSEQVLPTQLALLEVLVYSGTSVKEPQRLKSQLTEAVVAAQRSGQTTVAAKGLNALSALQFDTGDLAGAHESTLRAADAASASDALTRARQLGDSARCLAILERDMDQAQAMIAEARQLARSASLDVLELEWSSGLLSLFLGNSRDATERLERALSHARSLVDRWAEYECLRALVQIDLECGAASPRCAELLVVASKMGEGSEVPAARALEALNALVRNEPHASEGVDSAVAELRSVDAKGMSAYVLVLAAECDVEQGRLESAEQRASEALRAAAAVNRQSQVALARAVLAKAALARGDAPAAQRHLEPIRPLLENPFALSARARAAVAAVSAVENPALH